MAVYALCAAVLTAGFYAFPGLHMVICSAIGVSSAAMIVLGVQRNRPRRRTAWWVLPVRLLGCAGLLASDVVYGLGQLNGSWQIGGPIDLGWIELYVGWGLAALHASMLNLTVAQVVRQGQVGPIRLTVLALSSLIAPAVLFV